MTWYIACFCGHTFSSEFRGSQCPNCLAKFLDGQPLPTVMVDSKVKKQMEDELNRVLELGEWGLLE